MDAMDRLNGLGQQIAREQDALLADAPAMERVREALAGEPAPRQRHTGVIAAGIGAAVLAAAAALFFWVRTPATESLSMVVSGSRVSEPEGTWVSAANSAVPVQFSDGSRIVLQPDSRVRIVRVTDSGAHMVVESGAARFDIVPRENANWRFSFGPFGVEVLGTQFEVSWNPDKDLFELTLVRGKVKVTGCVFGDGRPVLAGETVRASCGNRQFEISTRHAASAAPQSDAVRPAVAALPGTDEATSKGRATTPAAPRAAEATWQDLARLNRYADAYASAVAAGFDATCERSSAQDLSLLGASARLSGHPTQAIQAYQTLRSRFAGSHAAALAAFDLARVAFDQRRAYNDAAQWFSVYLREQPRGELAREALGRLMESQSRAGDRPSAVATAQRYLDAYPAGPHAALARSLLPR
jgi:TolA-binding protein